jgi:hypothetical protein
MYLETASSRQPRYSRLSISVVETSTTPNILTNMDSTAITIRKEIAIPKKRHIISMVLGASMIMGTITSLIIQKNMHTNMVQDAVMDTSTMTTIIMQLILMSNLVSSPLKNSSN